MRTRIYLPRNDLSTLESLPEVFPDVIMGDVVTQLLAQVELPTEDFLVGQSARKSDQKAR